MPDARSWRDQRREFVRYIETLAADWELRREAKELAHKELREARTYDVRLRKVILSP
jgi:hypothetical protein